MIQNNKFAAIEVRKETKNGLIYFSIAASFSLLIIFFSIKNLIVASMSMILFAIIIFKIKQSINKMNYLNKKYDLGFKKINILEKIKENERETIKKNGKGSSRIELYN